MRWPHGIKRVLAVAVIGVLLAPALDASDHADPIDLMNRLPQEGAITDLFVFPDRNGTHLVLILCVRRALTRTNSLVLEPYTYTINMDLSSTVSHDNQEQNFRYGGRIPRPDTIRETASISFRLKNDASLAEPPVFTGLTGATNVKTWPGPVTQPIQIDPTQINVWTGVADDPFIFPVFFKTNVVAMVMTVPMNLFPSGQLDWIFWAISSRRGKQIDHVGRSLRTQQPRFEILNKLHPRDHVAAIRDAHEHPTLMRDIFLRIGLNSVFAYRTWDQVPDVMLFTRRKGIQFGDGEPPSDGSARFPNGRRLEDDVAERLARYGDTLLKEISFIAGGWPRATTNDNGEIQPNTGMNTLPRTVFPYLAAPWPDRDPPPPPRLTNASRFKLAAIAAAIVALWLVTAWLLAYWMERRRLRRQYL